MVDFSESERLARETPFADSLPSIGEMFVASHEVLWVVDAIVKDDSGWTAAGFRHDGSIVGRLRGAVGRPMAFGDDRVVVRVAVELRRGTQAGQHQQRWRLESPITSATLSAA